MSFTFLFPASRAGPAWRSFSGSIRAVAGAGRGARRRMAPSSVIPAANASDQNEPLVTVTLLGPPNAGKSTLFNRLLDRQANRLYRLASSDRRPSGRLRAGGGAAAAAAASARSGGAIVSPAPGTTRDRRECLGRIGDVRFRLLDTAGVDGARLDVGAAAGAALCRPERALLAAMLRQTRAAAARADLILLLFDARVGVTSDLVEVVRWLRTVMDGRAPPSIGDHDDGGGAAIRRVVLLANKLEGSHWDTGGSPIPDHLHEAMRVGFGEPIPISALHGEGLTDIAVIINEIADQKRQRLLEMPSPSTEPPASSVPTEPVRPLQLAILGRPNVGKSTLVNALLGEDRMLVGSMPGVTRDAITIEWTWQGRPVQLVDTAGIRKRSQRDHSDDIEDMAVEDAMRAMKVADVAVLVIDADSRMLHRQELAIADAILKEGRSLVVAANKMDLVVEEGYSKHDFEQDVREQLEARFPLLRKTPIVPMSSLTGEYVLNLMPAVFRARDRWEQKISTGRLNHWLGEVLQALPPPRVSGRVARIKYMMQTKGRPPTFLLFCNTTKLPDSYTRHLARKFQDDFEMFGMEIRFSVKKSAASNPYA